MNNLCYNMIDMSRPELDNPQEGEYQEVYKFLDGLLTKFKKDQTLPRGLFGVGEAFDKAGYHVSSRADHRGFRLSKEDVCEEMGGGSCIVLIITDTNPPAESGLSMKTDMTHIHSSGNLARDMSWEVGLTTKIGPDGKPEYFTNPANIGSMLRTVQEVLRNLDVHIDIPKTQ